MCYAVKLSQPSLVAVDLCSAEMVIVPHKGFQYSHDHGDCIKSPVHLI